MGAKRTPLTGLAGHRRRMGRQGQSNLPHLIAPTRRPVTNWGVTKTNGRVADPILQETQRWCALRLIRS